MRRYLRIAEVFLDKLITDIAFTVKQSLNLMFQL